jgi:hypothetical protein
MKGVARMGEDRDALHCVRKRLSDFRIGGAPAL